MTDFDPKTLEAAVGRVKSLRDRKVATAREWIRDDISNSTEGKDVAAINTLLAAIALYQTTLAEAERVLGTFAKIKPSSFFFDDGSEGEEYIVTLKGGYDNPAEFTGTDLAGVRALCARLKTMGLTND